MHRPQTSERPAFWNDECTGLKRRVEVTFNGMTSLKKFMEIGQLAHKLLAGETQTNRRTDSMAILKVSLPFVKECRLIQSDATNLKFALFYGTLNNLPTE